MGRGPARRALDDSIVLIDGPWTHRTVAANGIALHAVETGTGPLVILIHGFPQFWWTWRQQLIDLADAGYRAVAIDLRGYGASDKPPRGYDAPTLAADIAGIVTALGERDAMLVGSGIGGTLAFTAASLHPRVVRRLVVLGAAHPLRMRQAVVTDPRGQGRASAWALSTFQIPRRPELMLTRDSNYVRELFDTWSGSRWRLTPGYMADVEEYARAMRIHPVAHCSVEYFRWLGRSQLRTDGRRYARQLQQPIVAPTLHLHGSDDQAVLPSTAQGSGRYVTGEYEWRLIPGVGHFLQNETPELVSSELIRWAKA
jgi:pimeloyl-ACP methyl ester carboxylesterase